ncbi:TetR/AcrR family transcriptional regulator [Actinoplanes sp. NBRC 103695]|uniref:TetR/AcrR family transcriptional regulator n=1 Tax=Actinoplanes sp. NBRC 103695 TaxID=3032202 RepID=UPI0024A5F8CD|nr:TetR/AcrR family transcriptional regulator [Actinoplanes sp. NBRC 103695]GLY99390.1 TetR family transcriptional regulator [Actinoplanes sp. NBRC 103695]
MAKKRQARFTTEDLEGLPELEDESPMLWDESRGEVQRRLLTAAVRCFASNGFHATTTRDISGAVGLSPAALYVHFPSKEDVLFEIIRTAHARALAAVTDPALTGIEDPVRHLWALVARYTEWHARYHVAARVSQYELAGLSPEHYEQILETRHRTNVVFRSAVERGVTTGAFAEVDVKRVARAILSLGIDLVRWYRRDGSDSPEQLGEFTAQLALKMAMTPDLDLGPAPRPESTLAS